MHDEGTDSRVKIFANIFISFIGAGILGLPYAFREAGLVEGIIVMASVGAVSVKAMLLLIDCKDKIVLEKALNHHGDTEKGAKKKANSRSTSPQLLHSSYIDYGDVGYAALGVWGKWLVDVAIIISQIGFCCAYLIFITENLYSIFPRIPQIAYLFSLLVPLIFLCNLRHLKNLGFFSLFADFATIFAYGIVFYFDMEHFHLINFHIRNYSLEGLPFYLGVAIYCYEGAGLILSLEASVAKERKNSFRGIFKLALVFTTMLYIVFGICGYLSFGPDTQSIITLNLPSGIFPFVVKGCLCFSLFFTYPVMMFPVSKIMERMMCFSSDESYTTFLLGCFLRSCLVLLTGVIVLLVPNFSTMMALVGSSCCPLLAFILPSIFHWKLFKSENGYWSLVLDIVLILLGIAGSLIGTRDAVSRLFADRSTSKLPTVAPSAASSVAGLVSATLAGRTNSTR